MATRRPRVPKTSQRRFAEVGAGASSRPVAGHAGYDAGHSPRFEGGGSPSPTVGGFSAKVIPLDAAPSRHASSAAPESDAAELDTPETVAADAAGADAAEAESAAGTELAADPEPAVKPELTAEQRRAEARRTLLSRSTPRLRRRGPRRASPAAPASSVSPASQAPPEAPTVVEPVPARNFTGRSVAFLVVLFVAAVLLAPTLRVFLDQQAELRSVREDIAAERQLEQELTNEIARWDDPAYIQQQARERFNLVMPGEQTYMVIGGDEAVEDPVPAPASPGEVNPDLPWADALWDSVVRAGTD
ncbi:septum formation initiator family protein [Citricoccus nitrophenolicus]|uniref:Septum formation initiator family protein n=1 Tax=Citricoccus nitrophenolicus TaxID=863575 RepID=A0ABV0IJY8_9MICC|nr:septum formation initiator family protein [Citricoccus sp. I39-566]WMY79588.1 septum formation initiator family protein [Citricoccus sp. I39-566]